MDTSLISNIQKLFHERIEVFGAVDFNKLSIVTGIIKIALKVINNDLIPKVKGQISCSPFIGFSRMCEITNIW